MSQTRQQALPLLDVQSTQQWEPGRKGRDPEGGWPDRLTESVVCLAAGHGGPLGKQRTKPGQSHHVKALPAVPPPLGAHAAANLKFAFLPPARVLGPPPRALYWWVPRPILDSRGAGGEEGASLTGTEAWEVGRAEIWGCSLHLSPDGTAWVVGVGQDDLLLRARPGTWLSQRRRTAAGKWPPGLERPHYSMLHSGLVPSTRLEAPNRQTPAPAPLAPSPGPPPHPHFPTLSLILRSLQHQPMNTLNFFFLKDGLVTQSRLALNS